MRDHQSLRRIAHVRASLGESPVWDARKKRLYFVDISGGTIHVLRPQGQVETVHRSVARIGALGLTDKGNLIFTEDASVATLDLESGEVYRRTPAVHDGGELSLQRWRLRSAGAICHRPHE